MTAAVMMGKNGQRKHRLQLKFIVDSIVEKKFLDTGLVYMSPSSPRMSLG